MTYTMAARAMYATILPALSKELQRVQRVRTNGCAAMQAIYYLQHLHFPMSTLRIIEVDVSRGYVIANGERMDPFDVVDSLHGSDDKMLLHDLDGRKRNKHQFDLIQDLSAEIAIWYEGCFQRADNIIDPIVAGAERIIVDTGNFTVTEFEAAIRMTDRVVIDMDFEYSDGVRNAGFSSQANFKLRNLLEMGYTDVILSPENVKSLSGSTGSTDVNLWIRTDKPLEDSPQLSKSSSDPLVKVRGRIAPLRELEDKDD